MKRALREIIEENGWSLRDVAKSSGAGYTTVTNFIKGKTVAGDGLLSKLAPVFKISADEIENPQPQEGEMREGEEPSDYWMRRALIAEKQIADMRISLREILDRPGVKYDQKVK